MSDNNKAIVVKVNKTEEIPGMDNIHLVKLFGTQVITSKDVKEGDIMVYVDSNMKMSPEFLHYNNLYRHSEFNKHPNQSGYFDDNGRVKAIKMKGVISDGFLFPESYLSYIDRSFGYDTPQLKVGEEFNEIQGYKICEKYVPPQKETNSGKKKGSGRSAFQAPMFVEHFDTTQFMRNKHKIPPKTMIYIEEKVHGTSHRTGYVNVGIDYKISWWEKLLARMIRGKGTKVWKWVHLNGTRRVTHTPDKVQKNPYHDPSMRQEVLEHVRGQLLKGEQLYIELFGYEKSGKHIQKGFPYGCEFKWMDKASYDIETKGYTNHKENNKPLYRAMLYRVTMNNEDGNVVDYPREYVYRRAEELNLEKPHLFEKFYYSGTQKSMENLEKKIIEYAQGQSAFAEDTLKEGVVIWFINDQGKWEALKYKSDAFRLEESKLKDKGYIDQEDVA